MKLQEIFKSFWDYLLKHLVETIVLAVTAIVVGFAPKLFPVLNSLIAQNSTLVVWLMAILTGLLLYFSIAYFRMFWQYEKFHYAYGVLWDKDYEPRCTTCKKRLKYSSYDPTIFHCSDKKCDNKFALRTNDGAKLTKLDAANRLRERLEGHRPRRGGSNERNTQESHD